YRGSAIDGDRGDTGVVVADHSRPEASGVLEPHAVDATAAATMEPAAHGATAEAHAARLRRTCPGEAERRDEWENAQAGRDLQLHGAPRPSRILKGRLYARFPAATQPMGQRESGKGMPVRACNFSPISCTFPQRRVSSTKV